MLLTAVHTDDNEVTNDTVISQSVTHGQCDARPTVTFPAAERHRPMAGTKLHHLVTEAHGREQLAQSCYLIADQTGIEPASDALTH